ncbi:hypothetical protein M758_3G020700 [Ceratodon purpureus]|nr:hypothetical protein M758_3G020700 [Ceratodon purpureus]
MAPKKVSIMEPPKEQPAAELGEFSPPPESPAEIKARLAAEREAEQKELDSAWKKISYVDQKDLGPGYYCGYELNRLLKPWQEVKEHPHDFYRASPLSRPTDLAKHYEFGELLKRHDRLIFELESWRERENLKDDMRAQMRKMYMIQKERVRYQKLRKEIRAEQLQYESTLRWPLSPHAVRSGFDTDDEEEEAFPEAEEGAGAEIPEGLPPSPEDVSGPDPSSSEAGESEDQGPKTSRRKKKAAAPRMRYSLFHYDLPRRMKRVITHGPDEKPPEYSSPKPIHSPAWIKGKSQHTSDLAQQVIDLCAWEEKLPGGGIKL